MTSDACREFIAPRRRFVAAAIERLDSHKPGCDVIFHALSSRDHA
jgi:hypothetical protein